MADEVRNTVTLKLLIDTSVNKVLFAEASKDFVDFLFHILSLPVGMVVKLLKKNGMVGCLGDLYKSIGDLSADYLQPDVDKASVLKPTTMVSVPLLSLNHGTTRRTFYICSNCHEYITDAPGQVCPDRSCGRAIMSPERDYTYVPPNGPVDVATSGGGSGGGGYVKGVVTYMVMDNLEVKPTSTISAITLINKFHVQDVSSLVEKEVQVGANEKLAMLKASFETEAVLTTVFLETTTTKKTGSSNTTRPRKKSPLPSSNKRKKGRR